MQDPADPGNAEPEKNGQDKPTDSPDADEPPPNTDIEPTAASTVLAEVLPGVAVVLGEVPAELKPDLIDFWLVPAADRKQTSTVLASIGNMATVAPSLGNAFASVQGLYRLSDARQLRRLSEYVDSASNSAKPGSPVVRPGAGLTSPD
jgi:hypothetical protein